MILRDGSRVGRGILGFTTRRIFVVFRVRTGDNFNFPRVPRPIRPPLFFPLHQFGRPLKTTNSDVARYTTPPVLLQHLHTPMGHPTACAGYHLQELSYGRLLHHRTFRPSF